MSKRSKKDRIIAKQRAEIDKLWDAITALHMKMHPHSDDQRVLAIELRRHDGTVMRVEYES